MHPVDPFDRIRFGFPSSVSFFARTAPMDGGGELGGKGSDWLLGLVHSSAFIRFFSFRM